MTLGRPRKTDADRRHIRLTFCASRQEADQINTNADHAGLPRATFLRNTALHKRNIGARANQVLIAQLGRYLSNLNQLMKAINSGYPIPTDEVQGEIGAVRRLIADLKAR